MFFLGLIIGAFFGAFIGLLAGALLQMAGGEPEWDRDPAADAFGSDPRGRENPRSVRRS